MTQPRSPAPAYLAILRRARLGGALVALFALTLAVGCDGCKKSPPVTQASLTTAAV